MWYMHIDFGKIILLVCHCVLCSNLCLGLKNSINGFCDGWVLEIGWVGLVSSPRLTHPPCTEKFASD